MSFSGGRDSSLILAVACDVARREGLPLPAAVTLRHPSPGTDETKFQEAVIRHLGVEDWVTVDVGDSMDVLGDTATGVLGATGVQAPPNAYLHLPLARAIAPGTLLTGVGGDELLGTAAARLAQVLAGRVRPAPRDLLSAGLALAPSSLRRRRETRWLPPFAPWLTPAARADVRRHLAAERARHRVRWDVAARQWARSRTTRLGVEGLRAVGKLVDVDVVSPLTEPQVVDAFAREMGVAGPVDRTNAMRHLAGDLLPEVVLDRRSKAVFDGVVWGPAFRAFATRWSGDLLAPAVAALVDADELSRWVTASRPPYHCTMLVQHAWLREQSSARQVFDE